MSNIMLKQGVNGIASNSQYGSRDGSSRSIPWDMPSDSRAWEPVR